MDIPLVSISCITYNHESYIRDAIDGFLMQRTNFRFEVLIHDDASTDGTADIIREYESRFPEIIKPFYQKENQYSKKNGEIKRIQYGRARGKYYAFCEGDDFWIDPYKLQKQVDVLEANPGCGLVHTGCRIYDERKKAYSRVHTVNANPDANSFKKLFLRNRIITCTVVARRSLLPDFHIPVPLGDISLWLYIADKSKIIGLSDITSVYRVLSTPSASSWNDLDKRVTFFQKGVLVKYYFYINNYNVPWYYIYIVYYFHLVYMFKECIKHKKISPFTRGVIFIRKCIVGNV